MCSKLAVRSKNENTEAQDSVIYLGVESDQKNSMECDCDSGLYLLAINQLGHFKPRKYCIFCQRKIYFRR